MTLDEFVQKYNGKQIEYHSYGSGSLFQCTDSANQYIVEVLGLPAIIGTDAKDFPSKVNPNHYDFIPNPKLTVPEVGDIVVWSTNHISICTYSDITIPWFTSFDQNFPTGSVCHKVDHSYNNVSGWLHPKGVNTSDIYKGLDLTNRESMKVCVDVRQDVLDGKYVPIGEVNALKEEQKKEVQNIRIELEEEKSARKADLIRIAEKLACTNDIVEILKEVEKLIVAEEGLTKCLSDKRACEFNASQKATELKQVYENIKLLSGYPIARPDGVERAMQAFAKLQGKLPEPDLESYKIIIKIGGLLWLLKN